MINNRKHSAKTVLIDTLEQFLYKKTFQKISVNELCESAKVSRSAFYANFKDKYDLLASCLSAKTENIKSLTRTHSPEEFFTVILDFIQKEDRVFYNTFGAELEQETLNVLYQFFEHQFTAILNHRISQGFVLPGPVEIVSAFCIGGLTNITLQWIKSNYRVPKEEIAACQYRLLKDIL